MTTYHLFNLEAADPSWQPCLEEGLRKIDPAYLDKLYRSVDWLPGHKKIFSAFSLPVNSVNYVLFGESPYTRAISANGYAFWDDSVKEIWSETGFSKPVNRATSLRNIIKMLLIAEGVLKPDKTTQPDIASLEKHPFIETNTQLFNNLINHGFLLMNATPVLQPNNVRKDAIAWRPFIKYVLDYLLKAHPQVELILLGNIAKAIDELIEEHDNQKFYAEHPYNVSFINNAKVIEFFKPFHLLLKS